MRGKRQPVGRVRKPDAVSGDIQESTLDRRQFMLGTGAACVSLAASRLSASLAAQTGGETKRPNILFLLTDDQRWDAVGCNGNPIIRTPNMDRLAQGGVSFQNAFVTTSICMASRASILTGQYERRHGCTFGAPPLSAEAMKPGFPRWSVRDGMIRARFPCNPSVVGHSDRDIQWVTGENGHFAYSSTASSSSNSTERRSPATQDY